MAGEVVVEAWAVDNDDLSDGHASTEGGSMTLTLELPPDLSRTPGGRGRSLGLPAEQVARAALEAGLGRAPCVPRPRIGRGESPTRKKSSRTCLKDAADIPLDAFAARTSTRTTVCEPPDRHELRLALGEGRHTGGDAVGRAMESSDRR